MDILIPLVLFLGAFSVIGLAIKSRHTERMELIRQGIVPESVPHVPHVRRQGTTALFLGLLAVAVGLALVISAIFIQEFDRDTLTGGVILLFGGVAMLVYWQIVTRMASSVADAATVKKEIEDDTRIS